MSYLLAIKNWSFRLIVNSILMGIHLYWWFVFLTGVFLTGEQLLNFLITGEWMSTSLSTYGWYSDTQLLGWKKMVNWFYGLHIMFVVLAVSIVCAIGEFIFSRRISSEFRWEGSKFFFASH